MLAYFALDRVGSAKSAAATPTTERGARRLLRFAHQHLVVTIVLDVRRRNRWLQH
jgi:hypothetical protein